MNSSAASKVIVISHFDILKGLNIKSIYQICIFHAMLKCQLRVQYLGVPGWLSC